MSKQEQYQPTPEEIKKTEEMMDKKQTNDSKVREKYIERAEAMENVLKDDILYGRIFRNIADFTIMPNIAADVKTKSGKIFITIMNDFNNPEKGRMQIWLEEPDVPDEYGMMTGAPQNILADMAESEKIINLNMAIKIIKERQNLLEEKERKYEVQGKNSSDKLYVFECMK
ncbi:MAG: hypothetical protein NTZ97_01560 [Candidatus Moranbacteria bacterium]|nr:hypothetical protein [Candidatus Moranbacteria bacterium]